MWPFKKKETLPLWLFLFSNSAYPKAQLERIAQQLGKGKPVVCLCDGKPIKIYPDLRIEWITDYVVNF